MRIFRQGVDELCIFAHSAGMIALAGEKIGVGEPPFGRAFRIRQRPQEAFCFPLLALGDQSARNLDLRLLIKGGGFRNVAQDSDGFLIVAISVQNGARQTLRMIEFRGEIKRDAREGERHVVIGVADPEPGFFRRVALFNRLLQHCRAKDV